MAKVYMITETSQFMMSFVIVTENNNCIVIDGGRKEDMPLLKKYVSNKKIKAWILTHAHNDHIDGFVSEAEENRLKDFDIEKIYYNFPDYDYLINKTNVPDLPYFQAELNEMLPRFNSVLKYFKDKTVIIKQGDKIKIDELKIEFLYSYHDGLYSNLMNDSSLVFKIIGKEKSVLFLGDLGPEGGDYLYRENRDNLKSDIVQMAHHGHMNVSLEVYAKINPKICLWCAPIWLYEEKEIPDWMTDEWLEKDKKRYRMYGTKVTREWMELLGVKEHLVTGYGTQEFEI